VSSQITVAPLLRPAEKLAAERSHTSGQQGHEKMLDITNHQGNANQNHNELSPHICEDGYSQKDKR